ncbi:hypothetical protein [Anaeromicropila populeti]|uniref:Uncharacterized protein n=1 Tax=Anaeromicropila populeti TaxID=37658 RepID=A0A1I6JGX7_9FIRM|nr:hypothetical protein [Anaeromicropila populeti]SFR78114.1 hypothetical protein SAMN05661086_01669 [Anaeromicropila populeti]
MNRFENGFDSYQKAIVELDKRGENEFKLKAVIINFHHAIEVLFKHILYSKSKCLIYRDMNNWVNAAFDRKIWNRNNQKENTDYTISFDETVKRVIVIYDEQIDQYAYNGFLNLSKLRNALTHDEIELKTESVEQIVVTLTPIVTAILQKHLSGDEKEKFDNFVTSEKYKKILQQLIGKNVAWRITTISNLLELYSNRDYESLTGNEIRHLELTMSILNVMVIKEDMFCNIDDEYYITYISYLKQEICDVLICYLETIKKNEEIKTVIKRTNIIEDIVQEYLINATLYVYGLLNNQQYISFKNEEIIYKILDNNSFVNNNDIYALLHCIEKIVNVLVMITGTKKRKELLEKIYLDESQTDTIELIYSTLISWYKKNYWFNSINITKLDETIRVEIESDRVLKEVCQKIWDDKLYQELVGEFGEWGTIDRIDDIIVEQLETVVKLEHNIILVYYVSFSTQTYTDHEYYDNGGENCFIKVVGYMEDNRFIIDEAQYMGTAIGFRSFTFD